MNQQYSAPYQYKKMGKFFFLLLLTVCFSSCFLFKEYKRKEFAYVDKGQPMSQPIVVPKGYTKQEQADTAGINIQTFYYPGGAILYTAYLTDTTVKLQPINDSLHQPLHHRLGGLVY